MVPGLHMTETDLESQPDSQTTSQVPDPSRQGTYSSDWSACRDPTPDVPSATPTKSPYCSETDALLEEEIASPVWLADGSDPWCPEDKSGLHNPSNDPLPSIEDSDATVSGYGETTIDPSTSRWTTEDPETDPAFHSSTNRPRRPRQLWEDKDMFAVRAPTQSGKEEGGNVQREWYDPDEKERFCASPSPTDEEKAREAAETMEELSRSPVRHHAS